MLSPLEARERLSAYINPNHIGSILLRLYRLNDNLSELGQLLLYAGPAWKRAQKNRVQVYRKQPDVLERLGKLTSRDRQALFKAILPRVAGEIEATWQLFDHLPYQVGYSRRPFRNPDQRAWLAKASWFQRLALALRDYDEQDITWLAGWAAYLGYNAPDALGYLFAGAIERGGKTGQEVFDILIASGNGTHETGAMGRHVVRGLLCASRPDGWEFIQKMLLAAQREEGLRQVILESLDESHPEAFRRMLRIVLEHNLSRFSAAMRAFDVWFGLAMEAAGQRKVNEILTQVLGYLESPAQCLDAVHQGTAQDAYHALWAMAFQDAQAALPYAIEMRRSPEPGRRFAATHLLAQMSLKGGFQELLNALEDDDLRMPARALTSLTSWDYSQELLTKSDMFERLERLITHLPNKQNTLKPLVWDWFTLKLDREIVAGKLIDCLGDRPVKRLVKYLPMMMPIHRAGVAQLLQAGRQKNGEALQILLGLAGDPSSSVREVALSAIKGFKLREEEIERLEELLKRQAGDLRRGIIQVLLELPDRTVLKSATRLLEQKNENQHRAALELLRECKQKGRAVREAGRMALAFKNSAKATDVENRLLTEILSRAAEEATLEDALGLMVPGNRTRPELVRTGRPSMRAARKIKLGGSAAAECLRSLDELVEEHGNDEIEIGQEETKVKELLGNFHPFWTNAGWMHARWKSRRSDIDYASPMLLGEIWEKWWNTRSAKLRDDDGMELIRARALLAIVDNRWMGPAGYRGEFPAQWQRYYDTRIYFKLNYQLVVQAVLECLISSHPVEGETDFIMSALDESVRRIPGRELIGVKVDYGQEHRIIPHQRLAYLSVARWHRRLRPDSWNNDHHTRLWKIVRWLDEPKPGLPRLSPDLEDALFAYQAGAATRDDLLDLVLGPRDINRYGNNFQLLHQFSGRKPDPIFQKFPILKEVIDDCRQRIIEVETKRGDLPTAASEPATNIRSVPGLENLFILLDALGKNGFARGHDFGLGRSVILSRLIRNSYPLEKDTPEKFVHEVELQHVPERRLIELAVYAPQWAAFVQQAVGWPKLSEAVWWVYAHTKDRQWRVEQDLREEWARSISEYTPLSPDNLMDGAVDVAWFHAFHPELGEEHWQAIYRAAEYAASGIGHTRARLFADAMLGRLPMDDCIERIHKKRHQDSVRSLGLIPLPKGAGRKPEVLRRYEVMQEFLRTGKKFGSMRQTSERLAVAIGMENLARNAGYADPQRLEWAMESEAVADLAKGPVSVEVDQVKIDLSINGLGEPELDITRNGKPLKAIPPAIKKDERVAALLERKQKLDRQLSRMRLSLERTMCRGDLFSPSELKTLFQHPMLQVMIEQIAFISSKGMGYPIENGKKLLHHDGRKIPIAADDQLRIAHPLDLLESKEWHLWQHECFIAERIQPFKQVFRELYLPTATEKGEGNISRRYAGQQVNPRQAMALFGARGWVADPNEGVQKTFHEAGISARVGFLYGGFTPAEVEGLTIEAVVFTKRGEWKAIALEKVPARLFSEVMRDLDLVVSVAHMGGIDPEASASSIETRAALIRETCGLLNLTNIQLGSNHVLVNGKIGNYNVHLGSGVVHKQPGGALCIIPVHSQQRGRLFLPFVDNDPKSAEIVSKVLLLARDDQIKDPTILEQIINS